MAVQDATSATTTRDPEKLVESEDHGANEEEKTAEKIEENPAEKIAEAEASDKARADEMADEMADEEARAETAQEKESVAMAAMLGFSAFGTAPCQKRKYNPPTDGRIDDFGLPDRGGKRGKGSGGNQIPLGKTRFPRTVEEGGAAREIDAAPTDSGAVAREKLTSGKGEMAAVGMTEDSPPRREIDASPRRAGLDRLQRRIDGVVTRTSYVTSGAGGEGGGGGLSSRARGEGSGKREWYVGYFDASCLTNPWEALERERGGT